MGGKPTYGKARGTLGKAKVFAKKTYERAPVSEVYYFHTEGGVIISGVGIVISLTLPPGNFEIEACASLQNLNAERKDYYCSLNFFLDDDECSVWESGSLPNIATSVPYTVNFKVMSTFTKSKMIRFHLNGVADIAVRAEHPSIIAKRVGAISYHKGT